MGDNVAHALWLAPRGSASHRNSHARSLVRKFQKSNSRFDTKAQHAGLSAADSEPASSHFYAFGQLALNYLVSFDGQTPPQRLNPQRLLQANIVG